MQCFFSAKNLNVNFSGIFLHIVCRDNIAMIHCLQLGSWYLFYTGMTPFLYLCSQKLFTTWNWGWHQDRRDYIRDILHFTFLHFQHTWYLLCGTFFFSFLFLNHTVYRVANTIKYFSLVFCSLESSLRSDICQLACTLVCVQWCNLFCELADLSMWHTGSHIVSV
jgi:hypothetical protein